jgi:hypothetical protein
VCHSAYFGAVKKAPPALAGQGFFDQGRWTGFKPYYPGAIELGSSPCRGS